MTSPSLYTLLLTYNTFIDSKAILVRGCTEGSSTKKVKYMYYVYLFSVSLRIYKENIELTSPFG